MFSEMTSGDLFKSAKPATTNPQLATGPQKCVVVVLAVSAVFLDSASAFLASPVGVLQRRQRTFSPLRAGSVSVRAQAGRRPRGEAAVATSSMAGDLSGSFGLGFDFGTSGARINVVDADSLEVVHEGACAYSEQTAAIWVSAMKELLSGVPSATRGKVARIAVSGTSASSLILDARTGTPTRGPRMYDFSVPPPALAAIGKFAPEGHTVRSSTSALAKLVDWHLSAPLAPHEVLAHQADFLAGQLTRPAGATQGATSDWNNALKLGYDVRLLSYPPWLLSLLEAHNLKEGVLPRVVRPGAEAASIDPAAAVRFGLPLNCKVVGGTTDSIAAFIAARATRPGQAVTSLGSTLAIKLLSTHPVDDSSRGVYSHRLGDAWLVGGASNLGCAVLRQEKFSVPELEALSLELDPLAAPALELQGYYPLCKPGERFPVNDPQKAPVLEPKPAERRDYLHAILHSISKVEAEAYATLADMGASKVEQVFTAGGGSANPAWTKMRQHLLNVPVSRASNTDAAYGIALLSLDRAS